jgi:NAD(P)-dependent dehydrogenase (short-subunit alcohol dehydrogenase family)
MDRWRGRVALVTGASAGIGLALADALAQHGMKVAACARNIAKIQVRAPGLRYRLQGQGTGSRAKERAPGPKYGLQGQSTGSRANVRAPGPKYGLQGQGKSSTADVRISRQRYFTGSEPSDRTVLGDPYPQYVLWIAASA